ncbi:MAG TPA: metallophosphoesterase [Pyrinomonadaceae bacterium]|nr:metallophosphoesterase [Pyrinomonadaceae bacterium]
MTSTRKRRLITFAILIAPFCFLGLWAFVIEPSRLIVHEKTIAMSAWPASLSGLRIAALSDIHAGSPFIDDHKLRLVVERTNALKPDVIVLLGDYMVRDSWHSTQMPPERIAEALKNLRAPLGVYAVLGNHDWWFDVTKVRAAFESRGIRIVDNEVVRLERNGAAFWLVGIADAWSQTDDIAGTSKRIPAGEPAIALTHNPDIIQRFPPTYLLTLAGHTHGGQVNLPFLGRRIVPSEFGQRYAAGHIQEDGKHLFVTTGIGTSVFPVRFRVPPEIALLTLTPRAEPTP